ncbi:MAG: hypothetical protein M3P93_01100 [Actinomycetota bacterium]|nr:hypothetical protein [Actinomycetota bacterium]
MTWSGTTNFTPSNPHPAVGTRPAAQAWSGPQDALRLAFSALVVVTVELERVTRALLAMVIYEE